MTTKNLKSIKKTASKDDFCFHCGLPIKDKSLSTVINNKQQTMCCYGCKAVADAIVKSGMERYYSFREASSETPKEIVPEFLQSLQAYDKPLIQKQFVHEVGDDTGHKQVSLILEGIVCSACVWLNEHYLSQLEGVVRVKINYSTHRATLVWDDRLITLSNILAAISRIGYLAHPYDVAKQQQVFENQKKLLLKQLGFAALFGMQTMMFAVALYSGDYWGISEKYKLLFRWLSLFLTMPVLFYSAQAFFKGAITDLKNNRAGMDVPITLGISIAFIASVYNTSVQSGHVYFDSLCMFVLLLLSVRYIELSARKKAAESIEKLADLRPAMANLVTATGAIKTISVAELNIDDTLLVKAGEYVAADGLLLSKTAQIDESLLTGEAQAVNKKMLQTVIAGSLNLASAITIKVTKIGQDTVLSSILRLVEEAQHYKPKVALLADKVAARFVIALILLVIAVSIYWFNKDASQVIAITVATLVVSCPCALSLATPAAISASIGKSSRLGVLVANTNALEQLEKANIIIFDKTGTLTQGLLSIESIQYAHKKDASEYLTLARSLEQFSEHPIATAFKALDAASCSMYEIEQISGKGISGCYQNKRYYLGSRSWFKELSHGALINNKGLKAIYLFTQKKLLATFYLNDPIKQDAKQTIERLKNKGKEIVLLSGDEEKTVNLVAKQLGIKTALFKQMPEQKLSYLKSLQQQGHTVIMVGDGINDAPVLAAADIAIAMSSGTDIASASADLIVKSPSTQAIVDVLNLSKKMNGIIKQNFTWAIAYNIIAIPFAVSGFLQPWLAAIGMSLSSLVVVINAMRLKS